MLWALMRESAVEMCVSVVLVSWLEVWTDVEGVEVLVPLAGKDDGDHPCGI